MLDIAEFAICRWPVVRDAAHKIAVCLTPKQHIHINARCGHSGFIRAPYGFYL